MANPVLIEVTRGAVVESRHRGAVAVVDADGALALSIGDIERPVFPRSAVKAIQALPLVESGAADAYGFGDRELALACASHSGEPAHVATATAMLASAGLDEAALECGSHWPSSHDATIDLAARGERPTQLHNNCSGKHAGFLCTCRHVGDAPRGYVGVDHIAQKRVRGVLEEMTGAAYDMDHCGIDGCSIPTYAIPLAPMARAFARLCTGTGLAPQRARAARRLMTACMNEPFFVAGTARACTGLMQAAPGRIFVKGGAEGVYCAALPELGLGIALKADDGAGRAAEAMVAAVLAQLLAKNDPVLAGILAGMARPAIENRRRIAVGEIRPAGALAGGPAG